MKKVKSYKVLTRCLLTASVLAAMRLFYQISTPGVDTGYFSALMEQNSLFSLLNLVSGNGLSGMSIMALSIGPYITASIVMQLMGEVFPKLKDMQKGKPDDRKCAERLVLGGSVAISLLEGIAMSLYFGRRGMFITDSLQWKVIAPVIWCICSTALAVSGKRMSEDKDHFIGNGVSLILLTNILSAYPGDAVEYVSTVIMPCRNQVLASILSIIGIVLLFAFTVCIHGVEKKIPVVYTAKAAAGRSNVSTLPVKLCPGGVVPAIFASGFLAFIALCFQLAGKEGVFIAGLFNTANWFRTGKYTAGVLLYIVLIFAFSYYYTGMTINPEETADELKKNGGIIPGVRPGKVTADYLRREMKWMVAAGAAALTVIAVIPIVLSGVFGISRLSFIGTSIIITVGVILETKKDIELQAQAGKYTYKVRNGGLFGYAEKKSLLAGR